jgi:hypothetical protein
VGFVPVVLLSIAVILGAATGFNLSRQSGAHLQGPNADATGLFPEHYSEKAFMDPGSTLISATAATSSRRTYRFEVDESHPFALVANCTGGRIDVSGASTTCKGGPGGLIGFCAGQHEEFTAHVTAEQPHTWGVAIYRTSPC